jgi:hypothetical protein
MDKTKYEWDKAKLGNAKVTFLGGQEVEILLDSVAWSVSRDIETGKRGIAGTFVIKEHVGSEWSDIFFEQFSFSVETEQGGRVACTFGGFSVKGNKNLDESLPLYELKPGIIYTFTAESFSQLTA